MDRKTIITAVVVVLLFIFGTIMDSLPRESEVDKCFASIKQSQVHQDTILVTIFIDNCLFPTEMVMLSARDTWVRNHSDFTQDTLFIDDRVTGNSLHEMQFRFVRK